MFENTSVHILFETADDRDVKIDPNLRWGNWYQKLVQSFVRERLWPSFTEGEEPFMGEIPQNFDWDEINLSGENLCPQHFSFGACRDGEHMIVLHKVYDVATGGDPVVITLRPIRDLHKFTYLASKIRAVNSMVELAAFLICETAESDAINRMAELY